MPQSHSQVVVHLIFSTKERAPFLDTEIRSRMHAYLATICRDLNATAFCVGGVADHVHVLTTLPRTLSQAGIVETLKKTSSKWVKRIGADYHRFAWQRGYGAFSVSSSQLDTVIAYIEKQEEHHRHRSFQDEYREFLQRHGIAFDEQYVWD